MLRKSAISAVEAVANNISSVGLLVRPLPGFPLAELVDSCHNPMLDVRGATDGLSPTSIVYQLADALTKPTFDPVPVHDKMLEELTSVVANSVRGNLSFARNTANPMIRAVAEAVNEDMKQSEIQMGNMINILRDEFEPIWTSTALESLVEDYRDIPKMGRITTPNVHQPLANVNLLEMLKTGSARFDKEVEAFIETVGVDFVARTYAEYFAADNSVRDQGESMVTDYFVGVDTVQRRRALIVFLLANRLRKEVQDGIRMSLDNYEAMMTAIIAQAGLAINTAIDYRDRLKKNRDLVSGWPSRTWAHQISSVGYANVTVNADVYDQWIDDGGCPEILFGSAISDRNADYSKLLAEGERYINTWKNHQGIINSTKQSELYRLTIEAIRTALTRQINSLPEEELPQGIRQPLHAKLQAALETCTLVEAQNLYGMVKRITCETLYSHRDTKKILDTYDMLAVREPDLNPREVASLTALQYLTDWMVKTMVVEGGKKGNGGSDFQAYTLLTLANATELTARVFSEIAGGEEVSTHLRGEELYNTMLDDTIAAHLSSHLSVRTPVMG